MTTLDLIKEHSLLVRPAVFSHGWIVGQFRGITSHVPAHAYCHDDTERQADTLEEAVRLCVEALQAGNPNPPFLPDP